MAICGGEWKMIKRGGTAWRYTGERGV